MTDTEIYQHAAGWRSYLCKQVGVQDSEDLLHEWFIALSEADRAGRIQGPFSGYARATLQYLMYRRWSERRIDIHNVQINDALVMATQGADPERLLLTEESEQARASLSAAIFSGLKPKQREILTRFYLHDESRESIEKSMGLTATQFRLLKTRSMAAYGAKGKARLAFYQ